MSIATEITRLQKSKNDIKSAIEEKGVTVGDGTIDTYADLISQITTGGVGLKTKSGTVEFADKDNAIIYHNFGIVPRMIYLWRNQLVEEENALIGLAYSNVIVGTDTYPLNAFLEKRSGTPTYAATSSTATSGFRNVDETSVVLKARSATYPVLEGIPYNWLVIE